MVDRIKSETPNQYFLRKAQEALDKAIIDISKAERAKYYWSKVVDYHKSQEKADA